MGALNHHLPTNRISPSLQPTPKTKIPPTQHQERARNDVIPTDDAGDNPNAEADTD